MHGCLLRGYDGLGAVFGVIDAGHTLVVVTWSVARQEVCASLPHEDDSSDPALH